MTFNVRAYCKGDEFKINDMFNEVFNQNRELSAWYWKYRDNPYGKYIISLATTNDGNLVSHYAGYPSPFCYFGVARSIFTSYQIGDVMTKPRVRNIGLGKTSLLARTAQHFYKKFCMGQVPFIYGFNTGNHRKMGTRYMDYIYIENIPYRVKDIKTNPIRQLTILKKLLSDLSIDEISSPDKEFDVFFESVAHSYKLLIRRDASYIRWRYIECPDNAYKIFTVRKRGRLIGWSVLAQRENRLIWGDALFDKQYPKAVSFLLEAVTRQYYAGIETIEAWFPRNPEWWDNLLDNAGFIITPEPNDLAPGFVFFGNTVTIENLQNYLYYTMGDSDLF